VATRPEVIYRPEKPNKREWPHWQHSSGLYLVTQGPDVLCAYFGAYYNVSDILDELVALGSYLDLAVWFDNRLVALVRPDESAGISRSVRYDSIFSTDDYFETPADHWPTREEWLADGGGKIRLRALQCQED
jgi:hypothetical protein